MGIFKNAQTFNPPIALESHKLSPSEKKVLALSGGFAPIPRNPRKLYLECIEQVKNAAKNEGIKEGKQKLVEKWVSGMTNLVEKEVPNRVNWDGMNITYNQAKAINGLRANPSITVKLADKGMGLVAMGTKWYENQVFKHLDSSNYKKLKKFNATLFKTGYNSIVEEGRRVGTWRVMPLTTEDPIEPCPFYILPKIHKSPYGSRPIAAATKYFSKDLSIWVANKLNYYLRTHKEVAINSIQIVNELESMHFRSFDITLLTYDVESLYPSINQSDCVRKTVQFLQGEKVKQQEIDMIKKALNYLLRFHFVTYKNESYRQVTGIATGACFAPPLANIYLLELWKPVWENFNNALVMQRRYIDDGLVIIKAGTKVNTIEKLVKQLGSSHPSIKITQNISKTACIFLDIYIFKGYRFLKDQLLDTQVYFKPTNKFLWLNAFSCHPQTLLDGVIIGELVRYIRLCSSHGAYNQAKSTLWKSLMKRGYDPKHTKKVFGRVKYKERIRRLQIVKKRKQKRTKGFKVHSPYHPYFQKLTWRQVVFLKGKLSFYDYSTLQLASATLKEPASEFDLPKRGGFGRAGAVKFRKGNKLKSMLQKRENIAHFNQNNEQCSNSDTITDRLCEPMK